MLPLQEWHKGTYSSRIWYENIWAQGLKELLEVRIIIISFLLWVFRILSSCFSNGVLKING